MAKEVVEPHRAELVDIMDKALVSTIKSEDFKEATKQAFTHKLAKTLMGKMAG